MSLPASKDFTHYRGDTFRVRMRLKDASDAYIDLTGYTFLCELRTDPGDAVAETFVVSLLTQSGPTLGGVELLLTAAETKALAPANYKWDLEVTFPGGDVQTPIGGKWVLSADVSRV